MSTTPWKLILEQLEAGTRRAAYRDANSNWVADTEVKQAILQAFRESALSKMGAFVDKFGTQDFDLERQVRLVPGGSSVRIGCYIAKGVVIMPPAYVNIGAYVDEHTLIDSHALVGSCAQVGKRVHVSAAAQIGGVLEPVGASPVIVEDDAFIGGNTGLYEGIQVGSRAVIAAGVILTSSTPIYDLVHDKIWTGRIPEDAVVVPGSRKAKGDFAQAHGLSVSTPIIVKYRDAKTDHKAALESALRMNIE
ncbi:MAG: 2,3,4,5-tetrahydropyridine-2,6-dicarboxylate N-succinyltransferase [Myxococcaceae bacterium]